MAKKKDYVNGINNDTLQWIVIIVAIIVAVKYLPALTGNTTNFEFSGFTFKQLPTTQSTKSCISYNIGTEFERYFTGLDQPRNVCNAINPGGWTQDSSEISCNVLNLAVIDCSQPFAAYGKQLCDYLNADWVCRPDYMGCLCGKNAPNIPSPTPVPDEYPEDIPEEETKYYCCESMGVNSCYEGGCPPAGIQLGVYDTLTLCQSNCQTEYTCGQSEYCSGSCPESYYCDEIWEGLYEWACMCINDNQEVHPDWKPDGEYYNPHDDTPAPEPDEVCNTYCSLHGVSVATSGTGTTYADNWCVVNCGGEGYAGINTVTYDGINCYCWTCHNEQFNDWMC